MTKKKSKANKQARVAEKKKKQEKKGDRKAKLKAAKAQESEEEPDLDDILQEYKRQQEAFHKVTETILDDPPRARTAGSFIASPSNKNELLLFGGEYFNGSTVTFFGDLLIYHLGRDEWRSVTSPNAPLPRSGHAWCRGGNQSGYIFLFGGEFSSPKQGTFYHYNDFWCLQASSREWTRLEPKGPIPPARSGHRMTFFKQYIILFGGFQDTSNQTKYLSDLWLYDTENLIWHSQFLSAVHLRPEPRSSFSFLPHDQGAVLYGGYSRVKEAMQTGKKGRDAGSCQKNILKSIVHRDCFWLRITPPASVSKENAPPHVRWEKRKCPANTPAPVRTGATMAYHKGRGIYFGGVHDVEESEEDVESEFFNQLYAFNVERNRFFPLPLRKPRFSTLNQAVSQNNGRRARALNKEEELIMHLVALENGKPTEELEKLYFKNRENPQDSRLTKQISLSLEMPHPRFNSLLTIQGDTLFIYGGTYEKKDREITFDDLYAIDLGKMNGCKVIHSRLQEDWMSSEGENENEDDESEVETVESDEEYEGGTVAIEHHAPNKRASRKLDELFELGNTATKEIEKNEETEALSSDGESPQPRPFESRREFFMRTANLWQDIFLTKTTSQLQSLDHLNSKELKAKAFDLSERKWWDCREEISALEEQQEAAGISKVVSLVNRGDIGGSITAGRRR